MGSLESYIGEFQRLSVMVTGISERRLTILFIEGLFEPMKGWIKAFDPPTLQETMRKAHSMELTTPHKQFGTKPSSSYTENKSNPKKADNADQKKRSAAPLDQDTMNDLRRRKLCFYCKGPYDFNHDCPLKPKGQNRHMEWFYEGETLTDFSDQQAAIYDTDEEKSENEAEIEVESELQEAHMSSMQREGSFRLCGILAGQRVISLFDTGTTHNFIDSRFVEKRGIQTQQFEGIRVKVADGHTLTCERMIPNLPLKLNNFEFKANFYVVNMGGTDIVLGMKWRHAIGEFTLNCVIWRRNSKLMAQIMFLKPSRPAI